MIEAIYYKFIKLENEINNFLLHCFVTIIKINSHKKNIYIFFLK